MTIEEKLQHLKASSMEEARIKAKQIADEYEAVLASNYEAYKKEHTEQTDLAVKQETERAAHTLNKELAREHLKAKRALTWKNEELKDQLFGQVRNKLAAYRQTEAYDNLLLGKIREAGKFAKESEWIVYLDPEDSDKLAALAEASGAQIKVHSESFGGGIRTEIPSRHILIDESFESRLKEAYEQFSFTGGSCHE